MLEAKKVYLCHFYLIETFKLNIIYKYFYVNKLEIGTIHDGVALRGAGDVIRAVRGSGERAGLHQPLSAVSLNGHRLYQAVPDGLRW